MQKRAGFTFMEVMISMVIMGIVLIAGFSFFVNAMKITYNYSDYARSLDFAISNIERCRQMPARGSYGSYNSLQDANLSVGYEMNNRTIQPSELAHPINVLNADGTSQPIGTVNYYVGTSYYTTVGLTRPIDGFQTSFWDVWCITIWPITLDQYYDLGLSGEAGKQAFVWGWNEFNAKISEVIGKNPNIQIVKLRSKRVINGIYAYVSALDDPAPAS